MKLWLTCIIVAFCTYYCGATLLIQRNGMMSTETTYCVGDELQFTCTLAESGYEWVALPFLNGSVNNGGVQLGVSTTVGRFTLSASGAMNDRISTLQVTAFPGLNGSNVLCREAGGDPSVNQNVDVTVLGDPSAPTISDIISKKVKNSVLFDLFIDPPARSTQCVKGYVVKINGAYTLEVLVEQRPPVRQTITVNTADVAGTKPCQRNHNFTVRADNSNEESEAVEGFFNYSAYPFQFGGNVTENTIVISVPQILQECILGYEHTYLNNTGNYTESVDMIPLDLFPNNTECSGQDCRVTLTPIIRLEMTILTNSQFEVYLNSATPPPKIPTTDTPSPPLPPAPLPVPIIAGVIGGVVGLVSILLLVVIGLIIYKKSCGKSKNEIERPLEPHTSVPVDNHELLPTYQDPASIKRETTGQSGDLYTVPQKKPKKGSAKNTQNEELPVYSVVDKSAKQQDGLVYADIDVKNPVKPRSRPPAPPGVTEHDPMEPVVYSVVHK